MAHKSSKRVSLILCFLFPLLFKVGDAQAMHISEGILPLQWAAAWYGIMLPFLVAGLLKLKKKASAEPIVKAYIGMAGAAVFLISAMPIPVPITGTTSHPAGTGLVAILIGPFLTVVVAFIALLIQALFLAHGGFTTLGANTISMGVAGAFAGYAVYKGLMKLRVPFLAAVFAAGLAGDWATYAATSLELALGLFAMKGTFLTRFLIIAVAFVPTQVPLGILEGFISMGVFSFILRRRPDLLEQFGIRWAVGGVTALRNPGEA